MAFQANLFCIASNIPTVFASAGNLLTMGITTVVTIPTPLTQSTIAYT